jgi:hypothetical protein
MKTNISAKGRTVFGYILKAVYSIPFAILLCMSSAYGQQIGYYDAPYTRYEADLGTLTGGSLATAQSFQSSPQSEASNGICVNMSNGSSVSWTVCTAGNGLVVRYSVPSGQTGSSLGVYVNGVSVGGLNLSSNWSWVYLSNSDGDNVNDTYITNPGWRKMFDEVRLLLPATIPAGATLKLVAQSANISIDFAELEAAPSQVAAAGGDVVYTGNGSDLPTFINSQGNNASIYLPAGTYNVGSWLHFTQNGTKLKGAGSWYTQINFTNTNTSAANCNGGTCVANGGMYADASGISYSGLYLTTSMNQRNNSYKAINGVYTSGSTITDVWVEHFQCGVWTAQYLNNGGPANSSNFTISGCRFRDNYADGTNLNQGTSYAVVQHCNYRNNGDDAMAIWPASSTQDIGNTFQYCTAENTWRASGFALYGGQNNTGQYLVIQDNVEAGVRVSNTFGGAGFGGSGTSNTLSNIIITRCGNNSDLFSHVVGSIDLEACGGCSNVQYVTFSCINVLSSKNDAIDMNLLYGGPNNSGFSNMIFQNILVNSTGLVGGGTGYGVHFIGGPNGSGTYCNMTYQNIATSNVSSDPGGSFSWTAAGGCPSGCSLPTLTTTSCASVLPVIFISLTGRRSGGIVELDWATGSEINNQKFIIERMDGQGDWQDIGEVAGAGNSDSKIQYSYIDLKPLSSKSYYRLKQVDLNGESVYSNIVNINDQTGLLISAVPNPFDNALTIGLNETGTYTIQIQDMVGRVIYQDIKENTSGELTISPSIPAGAYLLTVQSGSGVAVQKIIRK